ncbi:Peptidoglycan/LPS O-acetylase OafA/YrhL, contains acyltransferase and SGNH-hydrolase domains [Bosea sp. CRIB-10]|uniref:acyltransferase family protein n=1 Tax=Bosea sp. CRIB-10 TaxID=378404 RepID=UPI0008F09F1D|nr:acyltransferase [Bosea sp. CRIB-10]SFC09869.1 Peptidoglycan/LPS O-acetylase OafA/YrhL, contains acyltransferase and SGNH-hydrolase domains [Bosea sp. CRIB-10]
MSLTARYPVSGDTTSPVVTASIARNVRLQYTRAIAAFAVLFFHASVIVERSTGSNSFLEVFSGQWGAYGVSVFFALSGYLMGELIQRDDPARFLIARIARIYPPMLLVVALFWAAFFAAGHTRGIDFLSLTLAPVGARDYFLAVEWSLIYEMSYYVALAALSFLGLRRQAVWFATAWLAVVTLAIWTNGVGRNDSLPIASELPLQAINLPFILGFILADLARRRLLPARPILIAIPPILAAGYILPGELGLKIILLGVMTVTAAICLPKTAPESVLGRIGERLGDASYMLYLCHMPLMWLLMIVLLPGMPALAVWLGGITASVALSLVLAQLDLGIHRWSRRMIARASDRRARLAAIGFIAAFCGVAVVSEFVAREKRAAMQQAHRIVLTAKPSVSPSLRAEIDAVERMTDGTSIVRGYVVDLEKPTLGAHVAAIQNGQVLILDPVKRRRPALARSWARPDLERQQIGFVLMLPKSINCSAGRIEFRAALSDGRTVVPDIGPNIDICR